MMSRTQISLDAETHRRARQRASELGISLAEYVRRVISTDLSGPRPAAAVHRVFNLGSTAGSDIAAHKDEYVAEAVASRLG